MALESTQPLTEMTTRKCSWGVKVLPARKADYLTAICETIVYMWELRHLTILWAFTACYKDSFTFLCLT
jgi:hypothetical protein